MTTLYVTDQGAYLKVQHQQFLVFHQGELRCQVPVNRVSHIVLFGCCNLSHGAVSLALRQRIPVMYLSQKGRYFGRLETEDKHRLSIWCGRCNAPLTRILLDGRQRVSFWGSCITPESYSNA
jgi:CRISPR-associated endonuclease Cas1